MGDRARAAVVAIAAVLAVATGPAQAKGSGLGIRLTQAPVDRRDDPRARSYIVDHVAPGTTITRAIQVDNGTNRQAGIDLYASAAEIRPSPSVSSFLNAAKGPRNSRSDTSPSRLRSMRRNQSGPADGRLAIGAIALPAIR